MAIAYQSVSTNLTAATTTSFSIAKPSGLAVGDFMLAQVGLNDTSILHTGPSGWTRERADLATNAGSPARLSAIYWKFATAGDVAAANFTWTSPSAMSWSGGIIRLTGVHTGAPINAQAFSTPNASTANPTSPTITPSVVNTLLFWYCTAQTTSNTITVPASTTQRYNVVSTSGTNSKSVCATETWATATATGTRTGSITPSGQTHVMQILALAPEVAPTAATVLSATPTGTTTGTVTWQDNSNNETGFTIQYSTDPAFGTFSGIAAAANATSGGLTGLLENTLYYVRVVATNSQGSTFSTNSMSFTTNQTPPADPTGFSAVGLTTSTITATWTDAASNETGYRVQLANDLGFTSIVSDVLIAAGSTTYTFTSLNTATQYYVRVRAERSASQSNWAGPVTASTLEPPPINIPGPTTVSDPVPQGTYQVIIRSFSTGAKQAVVTNFQALEYTKRVNQPGMFRMVLNSTENDTVHAYQQYLVADAVVEIRRSIDGTLDWYTDFIGLLRDATLEVGESDTWSYSGPGIMSLLDRRVIAYDAGTVNYAQWSNIAAETVMKNIVLFNIGAQALASNGRDVNAVMTGFQVATDLVRGVPISIAASRKNVLATLQEIAAPGGIDFDVLYPSAGAYQFEVFEPQRGTDRRTTVTFSKEQGNATDVVISVSRMNERTVAIVGGKGEESARQIAVVTGIGYPTLYSEMFVDARQQTTTAALEDKGQAALYEARAKTSFTFKVLQTPATLYGRDYFVGDLVTARNNALQVELKVIGAVVRMTEEGEETIDIELQEYD